MDVFLLILRLALATVFGVAGIAKLLDGPGSRKALAGFGVPPRLITPLAGALPLAELAIAASMLFVSASWFGAIGAAAMLLAFTAAMVYQMAQGNAPDCHCFGQIHSEPVGKTSILRNVVLLALPVVLLFQGKTAQGLALVNSNQDVLPFTLGVGVVVLLIAAVVQLVRISGQQAQIIERLDAMELVTRDGVSVERADVGHPHEGLPIGARFPDFELSDVNGASVSLADLKAAGEPVLFLFVGPTCTPCKGLVPEFETWQSELAGKVSLVLVSSGDVDENKDKFGGAGVKHILLQTERELAERVKAQWTPTAVFMDKDGRVASHAAAGDTAIRKLVDEIKASDLTGQFAYFANFNGHTHAVRIGEDVPRFEMKDLGGNDRDASLFAGKETLVAFWSLTCGYCQQMIGDLRDWEKAKGADGPDLVVFSDGDIAANRELGLTSPVILDEGHRVSEKFGMYGTPSAVLVNKDGKIVSETAVGADDIWALVGKKKTGPVNINV